MGGSEKQENNSYLLTKCLILIVLLKKLVPESLLIMFPATAGFIQTLLTIITGRISPWLSHNPRENTEMTPHSREKQKLRIQSHEVLLFIIF